MCAPSNGRRQRKVEGRGNGREGGGRVEGWVARVQQRAKAKGLTDFTMSLWVRFINRERERETHQERGRER